ncbi:hypothetical protein HJFPF1_03059 [Paramyrothecium foliicola]|nr:hypothetical protein HJFPF1_03059 [Paramyrothecium foliicola]
MKKPWKAAAPGAGNTPVPTSGMVRSKTGQESIRGRISSPIPIPNPLDEEFPMRNPGTGIATTTGSEAADGKPQPQQLRPENGGPAMAPPHVPPAVPPAVPPPAPGTSSASPDSDAPAPTPVRVSMAQSTPPRRATTSAFRHSTISVESGQTGSTKAQPQRKKSTLRGALGKLFGRKKKTSSQGTASSIGKSSPNSSAQGPGVSKGITSHSRSRVLIVLQNSTQTDQQRTTSLPVSQYDRALRSHSIGPEDVLAIESARNSLNVDLSLSKRRPGAGEGYLIHARRATDGGWMGLSPRPASSQGRGSRLDRHSSDPDDIGRAITCDTVAKRRRSRSLSGLPGLEEVRGDARRRSDEIRYWRESYDPNFASPLMIPPSRDGNSIVIPVEVTVPISEEQATTPLQPFSFGNIATMNELAGMKITQAVSMDTRIGNLEARMRKMENVVTQLCNAVPNFKLQVDTSDQAGTTTSTTGADPRLSTRPSTRHSEASRTSFGDATFVASTARSTVLPPTMPFHRPLSISTIRGATSLPTISRDMTIPFTMEHYVKLVEMVETERSTRQALEAQIKTLSHQVDLMARASRQRFSHNVMDPPPTGKSFGERSAFDDDDEANDTVLGRSYRGSMMLEDSGIATGGTDDDDYSESFTTPHEEANGFDGGDYSDDDVTKRKTARTLSLSQLTLGKGQPKPNEPLPQVMSP